MITGTNTNPAAADFKLPAPTARPAPTISGFSTVYTANSTQFATKEEADALASLFGGTVTDLSEQWSMLRVPTLYQVELPNGVSLNAGLLADRFRRYGADAALEMTEAEVGMLAKRPASPSSPVRETPPTLAAAVPFHSANPTSTVTHASIHHASSQTNPAPAGGDVVASPEDTKLTAAARQFEALMIGTILKSATPADGGGILSGQSDGAGQSVYQMAMENFAQMLSEGGGLGLAELVTTQLRTTQSKASTVA
jgi:hypothetical protein